MDMLIEISMHATDNVGISVNKGGYSQMWSNRKDVWFTLHISGESSTTQLMRDEYILRILKFCVASKDLLLTAVNLIAFCPPVAEIKCPR